MMGVITAYLYYNLFGKAEKKQKIFMGDSGSLTIGFILGFLFIKFAMNNTAIMPYRSDSLLLAYTLLIVPCFDVVRVALTHIRKGTSIFHPDKNHIHHKWPVSARQFSCHPITGLAVLPHQCAATEGNKNHRYRYF